MMGFSGALRSGKKECVARRTAHPETLPANLSHHAAEGNEQEEE